MNRILVFAASDGDDHSYSRTACVEKIVQGLFRLNILEHMVENHMMEHLRRDEMQKITVDRTVKIALATMVQAKAAAIRSIPASAAYSETDHRRRELTVRRRTGAVLLMEPTREENVRDLSSTCLRCLKAVFRHSSRDRFLLGPFCGGLQPLFRTR